MKNIHILPTEKPSRLYLHSNNELQLRTNIIRTSEDYLGTNQHIYITSDEEIKEGVDQWYIDKVLNEPYNSGGAQYSSKQDVIILTTDPDLIKDGVQGIDDEFLEWFVKNPSCEEVEVEKWTDYKLENEEEVPFFNYKIIIPKEEPKIVTVDIKSALGEDLGKVSYIPWPGVDYVPQEEPKQFTLEQAAEKEFPLLNTQWCKTGAAEEENLELLGHRKSFIKGAKWRAERMYSEEEVLQIIEATLIEYSDFVLADIPEWFEQFKKK